MNFSIYIKTDAIEPQIKKSIEEFAKRLSRYCKISYTLVKDENISQKLLRKNTHCIVLDIDGETITSENFANKLNNYGIRGISDLSFFVGCRPAAFAQPSATSTEAINCMDFTYSIDSISIDSIKSIESPENSQVIETLTLSHMDFSPSILTMILYEQIYRSFRILRGEPYHK